MGLSIIKTGKSLGKKIVTNKEFEELIDTSDSWIRERTGIEKRHFVDGEDLVDLVLASVKELDISKEDLDRLGAIIVASCTSGYRIPSISSLIHEELKGNTNIISLDINQACSGYVSGLGIMEKLLKEGQYGILVGAEVFSNILNFKDRTSSIIFGDGSGALLLFKNRKNFKFRSGSLGNSKVLNYDERLFMEGNKVYRFSIDRVYKEINLFCRENNIALDLIDRFIFHQANLRIIESIAKKLGVDKKICPSNIHSVGNLSSASIPVLLDDLNSQGNLRRGEKLLLIGFGAGLSWSIAYMEL